MIPLRAETVLSQAGTRMGGQKDSNGRNRSTITGLEDRWGHKPRNAGDIKAPREALEYQSARNKDLSPVLQ